MQVAGTNGSFQKMKLEWLAGLKILAFILKKKYQNMWVINVFLCVKD